jgi:hypothetical protein
MRLDRVLSRRSISAAVASGVACPLITIAPNTMPLPFGSHIGSNTPSGRLVTARASPPSSGITCSCGLPFSPLRVNASWRPSGENAGELLESSGAVSGRASPPSDGTSQMRPRPSFFSTS